MITKNTHTCMCNHPEQRYNNKIGITLTNKISGNNLSYYYYYTVYNVVSSAPVSIDLIEKKMQTNIKKN